MFEENAPPAKNGGMDYSANFGTTENKPDTIAEAMASPEQLRGMYDTQLAQIASVQAQLDAKGIKYTIPVPSLMSYNSGEIQAALNAAQANCSAAEGVLLMNQAGKGIVTLAGIDALVGGGDTLAVGGASAMGAQAAMAGAGDEGLKTNKFSKEDGLFGGLLAKESIVALGDAKHFDRSSLGEFVPTHINGDVMKHIDLTGQKAGAEARGYTSRV